MKNKKIEISKNKLRRFFIVAISAFILTYALEHLGKVSWDYYPEKGRLNSMNFTSLLGNYLYRDVDSKNIRFYIDDYGFSKPGIKYGHNAYFYFWGVIEDILIPLSIILIYIIYLLFKRFIVIKG